MGATGKKIQTKITGEQLTYDSIDTLRKEMGQTGNEAGDPYTNSGNKLYTNSGKAFNINAYLNSDGATIHSDLTDWDKYIDKEWVKNAIKKMDAGMKPLSRDIRVTRFITPEALEKMTGLKITDAKIQELTGSKELGKDLQTALKGLQYTQKGYSSTTWVDSHPSYGDYPIALNMVMRKGTNAIITNNTAEHEIVGARNSQYNFTGSYSIREVPVYAKVGNKGYGKQIGTRKQLVLDVYV